MRTCCLTTAGNTVSAVKLGLPTYAHGDDIKADDWDAVLRWGNSAEAEGELQINPSDKVLRVCDKLEALLDLSEVVTVPPVYERMVPVGHKAVIRTMEHTQGVGFQVVDGPYRIPRGSYGTELIVTPKEFRVWYAFGAMRAAQRVALNPETDHKLCRSKWGYRYLAGVPTVMGQEAAKAFKRMGLETGAADILWHEAERKYYFLELNTAPAIDTESLETFFRTNVRRGLAALERTLLTLR